MTGTLNYLKHYLLTERQFMQPHTLARFTLHLPAHQNCLVDLMLARIQPSKLHSYPQFVRDSHKQLTSSYAIAKQQLQAQHLRQKSLHDSNGSSEPFQVGDRIWLYTPVVNQGHTKSLHHSGRVRTLSLISLVR